MNRGRSLKKAVTECYKYHNLWHFQYECPNANNQAHFAEIEEKDEVMVIPQVELQITMRGDAWFVDSA